MNKKLRKFIDKYYEFDNEDDARDFFLAEIEKMGNEITDDDFNELVEEATTETKDLLKKIKELKRIERLKKGKK